MGASNSCFSKTQHQHESPISSQPASNPESSGPSFDQPPVQKKKRTRYVSKGSSGEHPGSTSSVGGTISPDVSSGNGQSPSAVRQGHTYDTVQDDRQIDNLLKRQFEQFHDVLEKHKQTNERQFEQFRDVLENHKQTNERQFDNLSKQIGDMNERLRNIELHLGIVPPDNSSN